MHTLHSHFEVHIFEVSDDDMTHGTQKHYSPPWQTPICGHGNEEVHSPYVGSSISRTKACKLLGVQSKANKRTKKKKKKLDVGFFTIANAIKENFKSVKEIEKMKM
jgi:hypothetical protein